MSLSIHSITGQRAINRTVQYDNRLTEFTNPPIHSGDLYVKSNLEVRGDIHSYGNLDISGNERVSGTISASTFLPGQIINIEMINIPVVNDVSSIVISVNDPQIQIINYSYTPKNANSYIIAEFQTNYYVSGGTTPAAPTDTLDAYLYMGSTSTPISKKSQFWLHVVNAGSGTRSGTIFPIAGTYRNADTAAITIIIQVDLSGSGDKCTVYINNSTWLKITEISR